MAWNHGISPYAWPSLLAVLLLLALTVYSECRHRVPAALPSTIGCLPTAPRSAGSAMEYAALDADAYIETPDEVAREADLDTHQSILGLRVTLCRHGLFAALAQCAAQ